MRHRLLSAQLRTVKNIHLLTHFSTCDKNNCFISDLHQIKKKLCYAQCTGDDIEITTHENATATHI
jgi:hypothetical protein